MIRGTVLLVVGAVIALLPWAFTGTSWFWYGYAACAVVGIGLILMSIWAWASYLSD